MPDWKVTYLPRSPSNDPIGPYTASGNTRDEAIGKVCTMIQREFPDIDLAQDYNPQPVTEPPA
ncbi:hypothetical protein SAMN05216420_101385 [Nitrosospira sp. Nl5]|nr:hypothetical protein SAMN05216420_101385 [Nitrosospira sp. Nl5]